MTYDREAQRLKDEAARIRRQQAIDAVNEKERQARIRKDEDRRIADLDRQKKAAEAAIRKAKEDADRIRRERERKEANDRANRK